MAVAPAGEAALMAAMADRCTSDFWSGPSSATRAGVRPVMLGAEAPSLAFTSALSRWPAARHAASLMETSESIDI
eukprot:scaffold144597_cov34-Prasinocladus_malaysianus.AAC.1